MAKSTMFLEIVYDYHPTKRHRAEHWMYYAAPGNNLEECKASAEKYFYKQIRELGWSRITTLTGIGPIRRYNDFTRSKAKAHPVESDPTALAEQKENKRRRTRKPAEGAAAKPRPKRKRTK